MKVEGNPAKQCRGHLLASKHREAANIQYDQVYGHLSSLLWALYMWLTARVFNLVLNPGLAYAQGLTLPSLRLR